MRWRGEAGMDGQPTSLIELQSTLAPRLLIYFRILILVSALQA